MNNQQTKIAILLIGMLFILSMFVSIGNERDIERLEKVQDSLKVEIDSLELDLTYTKAKIELLEALR